MSSVPAAHTARAALALTAVLAALPRALAAQTPEPGAPPNGVPNGPPGGPPNGAPAAPRTAAQATAAVGAAPARAPRRFTVDRYLDMERVTEPRLSPDGRRVVYTRGYVNKLTDRWESALWTVDVDAANPRHAFLVKGANAVWSPDGTRLAYVAEGEPNRTPQLFVRYMDAGGATSQVTRVTEPIADLRWSPDGKSIAFSMFVPAPSPWNVPMPQAPNGATWTGAPRHVTTLHYRQDRKGFDRPGSVHLFAVSADGGTPRQLTSGAGSVGARFDGQAAAVNYAWTPDGATIVVEGVLDSTLDANYRNSNLYAVDVRGGATRLLTPRPGVWTAPAVSPDGRTLAFAGYPATRASYQAAHVWVMPLGAAPNGTSDPQAAARDLSGPALDDDPGELLWARDGRGLYTAVGRGGAQNVWYLPLGAAGATPAPRAVTSGAQVLTLAALGPGLTGVGTRAAPHDPADVVAIDLARGTTRRLTAVNADLLDGVALGEVVPLHVASTGGTTVDGWLVRPPDFDPARKYPLLFEIHGGPHAAYYVGFNPQFQNFAAMGYEVLYLNPRGSTGYGSAFGNAIERRYPGVDYDDLMAGVDAAIAGGNVDTTRMYVGGCSGGGVLSSWVIGHTDRFAAAAVRCPVIDWISMAGHTDVPMFTYNFFDKPFWEDPTRWLEQSSLMYVGHVTTPTLLMTGELDMRTPMPQSEEYYAALKVRGVPAELLRFEGEYHGTGSRPSNWMRTQLYMQSWYDRWRRVDGRAVRAGAPAAPAVAAAGGG